VLSQHLGVVNQLHGISGTKPLHQALPAVKLIYVPRAVWRKCNGAESDKVKPHWRECIPGALSDFPWKTLLAVSKILPPVWREHCRHSLRGKLDCLINDWANPFFWHQFSETSRLRSLTGGTGGIHVGF
jgi:hypothetical protein